MTDREILELLLQKVTNIEAEQEIMKSDIQSLKSDSQSMKSDIQSLKSDSQSMKTDIQALKSDSQSMKTDIRALKSDAQSMKSDIRELQAGQQRNSDLIHQLIKIVAATNAKFDTLAEEMRQGFEKIETDIKILFDEALNQKREIYRLKKVNE